MPVSGLPQQLIRLRYPRADIAPAVGVRTHGDKLAAAVAVQAQQLGVRGHEVAGGQRVRGVDLERDPFLCGLREQRSEPVVMRAEAELPPGAQRVPPEVGEVGDAGYAGEVEQGRVFVEIPLKEAVERRLDESERQFLSKG